MMFFRCRYCSYGTRDRVQLQKHYKAHSEAKKICKYVLDQCTCTKTIFISFNISYLRVEQLMWSLWCLRLGCVYTFRRRHLKCLTKFSIVVMVTGVLIGVVGHKEQRVALYVDVVY